MNNKDLFIKTSDEHTAELLRESGLPELEKENDKYVFANRPNTVEFASDNMKMHFTNIVTF